MGRGTAERAVVLPVSPEESPPLWSLLADGARDLAREYAAKAGAQQPGPSLLRDILSTLAPGVGPSLARERAAGYAEASTLFAHLAVALEGLDEEETLKVWRVRVRQLTQCAEAMQFSRGQRLAYREASLSLLRLYQECVDVRRGWA